MTSSAILLLQWYGTYLALLGVALLPFYLFARRQPEDMQTSRSGELVDQHFEPHIEEAEVSQAVAPAVADPMTLMGSDELRSALQKAKETAWSMRKEIRRRKTPATADERHRISRLNRLQNHINAVLLERGEGEPDQAGN